MNKSCCSIAIVIAIFSLNITLSAQYRVICFQGVDTVDLGLTHISKGHIVLPQNADKYTKIELVPISNEYETIEKRLQKLKHAYIEKYEEILNVEKKYIIETLNFKLLYYSPLYSEYLKYWSGIYSFTTNSKLQFAKEFKEDIIKTLSRLMMQNQKETALNLALDLTLFVSNYGFEDISSAIIEYVKIIDNQFFVKNNMEKILTNIKTKSHDTAPKIVGYKGDSYNNCLIIFFDSENKKSMIEIEKAIKNYDKLRQKGITIISIASDKNSQKYATTHSKLPWDNKLCDFYGLKGENFVNYGIIGIPAIFLTNDVSEIIVQSSNIDEILK